MIKTLLRLVRSLLFCSSAIQDVHEPHNLEQAMQSFIVAREAGTGNAQSAFVRALEVHIALINTPFSCLNMSPLHRAVLYADPFLCDALLKKKASS